MIGFLNHIRVYCLHSKKKTYIFSHLLRAQIIDKESSSCLFLVETPLKVDEAAEQFTDNAAQHSHKSEYKNIQ